MKRRVFLGGLMLFLGGVLALGDEEKSLPERVEGSTRSFRFTASKLGIPILRATIQLKNGLEGGGRPVYRIEARVRSVDALGLFFYMDNRFISTMEARTCLPLQYMKVIDQGGLLFTKKQYRQRLTFDPLQGRVVIENEGSAEKREVPVSADTYDPLSMFGRCYLREEIHPGQEIRMSIFDGIKLRQMVFRSIQEKVSLPRSGEVEAVRLESSTTFPSFGEKEGVIRIWYALDGKKTPLALELGLPVGTVKFQLDEAQDE
jgi:hypothetical protein